MAKLLVLIDKDGASVIQPGDWHAEPGETDLIASLIGKALTRVEIRDEGEVYLEFDHHGSMTIQPSFKQDVFTRLGGIV